MKTIFYFNSYSYGSTGTLCKSLHLNSAKHNCNSFFIFTYGDHNISDSFCITHKIGKFLSVLTAKFNSIFGKTNILIKIWTLLIVKFIKKSAYSNKEVIFHFHNMQYGYWSLEKLIKYANKRKIKIFYTMHDCWAFTGGCNYFSISNCTKWKTDECRKCKCGIKQSEKNLKNKRKLFYSYNNISIISPCKWMDNLVSSSICNHLKHYVVNNGINISFWNNSISNEKKGNITRIISVASPWDERKGLIFINKLAEILPKGYSIDVVGLTNENYTHPRINRHGIFKKEELLDLYNKSDIFLCTSLEDNFPTVIIEALLCGLYICSFDTGGCKEIFDNDTGSIIPSYDNDDILNTILCIKIDKYTKLKCRKRGEKFNEDKYVKENFELYHN